MKKNKSRKNKKNDNKNLLLILLVLIIAVVGVTLFKKSSNNKDIDSVKYASDLIGVNFSEYVIDGSGRLAESEFAIIKFKIDPSKVEEFQVVIENEMRLDDSFIENHADISGVVRIKTDTRGKNILHFYQTFRSGKKIKTRDIWAVLCEANEKYYFYLYG